MVIPGHFSRVSIQIDGFSLSTYLCRVFLFNVLFVGCTAYVVGCQLSSFGCRVLREDCQGSLLVFVVGSWLAGVGEGWGGGCRVLAVDRWCRLSSLTFSIVGAQEQK
jgi:hypothetical protein